VPSKELIDKGILDAPGELWCALDKEYNVIKSLDGSIAWLAKSVDDRLQREIKPPIYEESYFEGDPQLDGGYGKYAEQAGWRLEKAVRQLNDICQTTGLVTGRALDIGSGYGYFRHALELAGWEHDGLEISKHACQVAKKLYNHQTFNMTLDEYMYSSTDSRYYDLITLWDVIEHIAEPIAFLQEATMHLRPGGVLAIKTPNINCPEAEMFGTHYHSLKREHLVYFTDKSLQQITKLAGLSTHSITSISHLLKGFVGEKQTKQWEMENRGADLIGYFIKT
jgi:2-polyprenyl-3-methyl-5-hydroxy-6-metoxy-1,4-benzoquinol methylase